MGPSASLVRLLGLLLSRCGAQKHYAKKSGVKGAPLFLIRTTNISLSDRCTIAGCANRAGTRCQLLAGAGRHLSMSLCPWVRQFGNLLAVRIDSLVLGPIIKT